MDAKSDAAGKFLELTTIKIVANFVLEMGKHFRKRFM